MCGTLSSLSSYTEIDGGELSSKLTAVVPVDRHELLTGRIFYIEAFVPGELAPADGEEMPALHVHDFLPAR